MPVSRRNWYGRDVVGFRISRGPLRKLLGKEFDGVLGCDYFSAYRKYMRLNENVSLQFSEQTFRRALQRVRNELVHDATLGSPLTNESENLAERFYLHIDSYFRFITTPGIEPTNNLAEQAIRFVAIHRRLAQGTRGEAGKPLCPDRPQTRVRRSLRR